MIAPFILGTGHHHHSTMPVGGGGIGMVKNAGDNSHTLTGTTHMNTDIMTTTMIDVIRCTSDLLEGTHSHSLDTMNMQDYRMRGKDQLTTNTEDTEQVSGTPGHHPQTLLLLIQNTSKKCDLVSMQSHHLVLQSNYITHISH